MKLILLPIFIIISFSAAFAEPAPDTPIPSYIAERLQKISEAEANLELLGMDLVKIKKQFNQLCTKTVYKKYSLLKKGKDKESFDFLWMLDADICMENLLIELSESVPAKLPGQK